MDKQIKLLTQYMNISSQPGSDDSNQESLDENLDLPQNFKTRELDAQNNPSFNRCCGDFVNDVNAEYPKPASKIT